jgi:hypothetical protein
MQVDPNFWVRGNFSTAAPVLRALSVMTPHKKHEGRAKQHCKIVGVLCR